MTDIKTRARELLSSDELRGRVPEEVQALLRDIVALEPAIELLVDDENYVDMSGVVLRGGMSEGWNRLYILGSADHDPA